MSCTEQYWVDKAITLDCENILYKARLQEFLSSAKEYLPYMPISSAREGGAAKHSAMLIASDGLKAAIVNAEKLLGENL
jgi:hypothetical protein